MSNLIIIKERIEQLNKFHQVEILKILKASDNTTLNENKNGIFINMTSLSDTVIFELEKYLEYVDKQETQLDEIEEQKCLLSNTFFKDNKENPSITLNAEI